MDKKDLVAHAATELIGRFNNEINYIFKPRYTEYSDNRREQTNPYVTMEDPEKSEVVLESSLMLVAQILAGSFTQGENVVDQQSAYTYVSKRLRHYTDSYHQQFLHLREAEKNGNRETDSQKP